MATVNSYEGLLPAQELNQTDQSITAGAPAQPTPLPEIIAALRTVTQLDGLTEEEYTWLATHGNERVGPDRAILFRDNDPARNMHFILRGEVQVRRRQSGNIALFIGRAGSMTGKLPFSRMKNYGGEGFAVGPVWSLDIPDTIFADMLAAIPSMGQRCVSVLLDRVREVTRIEQQSEKLNALGKLAANLSHELNNPASAAQRSAASLFGELRAYGDQKYRLGNLCLTEKESNDYRDWVKTARTRMSAFSSAHSQGPQSPLAVTDREDVLVRWLEAHNVPQPWTIAPALSETNLPIDLLDELATITRPEVLPVAVATVASSLRVERMAETVVDSTVRIFDLISAIKDYSYMDQAPIQDVDLAQSLENTLVMFNSRLKEVKVELNFDPELPPVSAYGSELNQVWTALIENALESMNYMGTLKLIAHLNGSMALVEVWDDGPGIDPSIRSRIFEPFFTTKAPGRGLGLGLDSVQRIVSKHSGIVTVESKAGATCFQVRLPLDRAQAY
ncbi:MAG: sensor histidine kinase [Edaphobacter sp.]